MALDRSKGASAPIVRVAGVTGVHRGGMGRAPRLTAPELVRLLQRAGWREVRRRGSHALLRHPSRTGLVTVPVHSGRTLKPKTAVAILKAAGLDIAFSRGMEE
jgi:predicted RNA binding protein YcfA (HicA-like mRNA interferase family)